MKIIFQLDIKSPAGLKTLDLTGCYLPSVAHLISLTSLSKLRKLVLHRSKIATPPPLIPRVIRANHVNLGPADHVNLEPPADIIIRPRDAANIQLVNNFNLPADNLNLPAEAIVSDQMDLLLSSVLLRLGTLHQLHIDDPTGDTLHDDHIHQLVTNSANLRKLNVYLGCGINGRFIEKCTDLRRPVDVSIVTKKGCPNGDILYGRTFCAPHNLTVYVSWED